MAVIGDCKSQRLTPLIFRKQENDEWWVWERERKKICIFVWSDTMIKFKIEKWKEEKREIEYYFE